MYFVQQLEVQRIIAAEYWYKKGFGTNLKTLM